MYLKRLFKLLGICVIVLLLSHNSSIIKYKINNEIKLNDYYHKADTTESYDKFQAVLAIPKINLNQGLYSQNSKYNSVKYGLEIIANTDFPPKSNLLIIAGHSGNSVISYFKKLNKLDIKDRVILKYQNKKYNYEIYKKYKITKIGQLNLPQFKNKTLCLVTCDQSDKTKQIILLAKLKE